MDEGIENIIAAWDKLNGSLLKWHELYSISKDERHCTLSRLNDLMHDPKVEATDPYLLIIATLAASRLGELERDRRERVGA